MNCVHNRKKAGRRQWHGQLAHRFFIEEPPASLAPHASPEWRIPPPSESQKPVLDIKGQTQIAYESNSSEGSPIPRFQAKLHMAILSVPKTCRESPKQTRSPDHRSPDHPTDPSTTLSAAILSADAKEADARENGRGIAQGFAGVGSAGVSGVQVFGGRVPVRGFLPVHRPCAGGSVRSAVQFARGGALCGGGLSRKVSPRARRAHGAGGLPHAADGDAVRAVQLQGQRVGEERAHVHHALRAGSAGAQRVRDLGQCGGCGRWAH